ncbi:hypothetical protein QFX18_00345 [Saccharophagus degradans]|uniref:hypothetical protein n=1 Tax=Saccharophagus degradans TaxID=86304 RepID=UPI0024780F9D|nr:hypothetical protein [Saccharophagus degradans]WGO98512.1 hypothetical protein QFX18_00345 [Saccharophagus degradans]
MTTLDEAQQPPAKRNNKPLIAILLISIFPILAAYTMFFTGVGVPADTKNKGYLITPAVNVSALLEGDNASVLNDWQTHKKWRLLIPVQTPCNQACQDDLYTSRQVHIRLGEKSTRVQRIAVSLNGAQSDQYLADIAKDHPQLKNISVDENDWNAWLAQTNLPAELDAEHFYILVDQEGYAMMWYTPAIHGNDLLKDLKHALKFSIDYE